MATTDPREGHEAPSTPGISVLFADRDMHIKSLARTYLEAAGHTVTFAKDGAEALEAVRRLKPGLLITEILLPKLDGLALCRAVKADRELARTRVLVFSILAAKSRAREAGADGFLGKPLAQARFASALDLLIKESL